MKSNALYTSRNSTDKYFMRTYKRINEDYLDRSNVINETHGVLNTDDSAFNKLVERVNEDASLYPDGGNPISADDEITSLDNDCKILNPSTIRKVVYTNTGLDWLPVLNVYFAEYQKDIHFGGKSHGNNTIIIIIFPDRDINYTSAIAHEIRHCHTYLILDKTDHNYNNFKPGMSWRNKDVSIDYVERTMYNISRS